MGVLKEILERVTPDSDRKEAIKHYMHIRDVLLK